MTLLFSPIIHECKAFVVDEHIEFLSQLPDTQLVLSYLELIAKDTSGLVVVEHQTPVPEELFPASDDRVLQLELVGLII